MDKNIYNPSFEDSLFTIVEAAKIIRCGRTALYAIIKEGRLEAVKLGRSTLIKGSSIRQLIASLPTYKTKA